MTTAAATRPRGVKTDYLYNIKLCFICKAFLEKSCPRPPRNNEINRTMCWAAPAGPGGTGGGCEMKRLLSGGAGRGPKHKQKGRSPMAGAVRGEARTGKSRGLCRRLSGAPGGQMTGPGSPGRSRARQAGRGRNFPLDFALQIRYNNVYDKPVCRNGRRGGLKIPCANHTCGFDPHHRHQTHKSEPFFSGKRGSDFSFPMGARGRRRSWFAILPGP